MEQCLKINNHKSTSSYYIKSFNLGSHTSTLIKQQFDKITETFEINEKIFKIVADQADNVKCAFKNSLSTQDNSREKECTSDDALEFVDSLTCNMLFKQRKEELISQKENILRRQMNKVI